MNKIPNRQAICEVLMDKAKEDKDIMVLCSDSRGSASLAPFAEAYPGQFVEMGIAEQDLVSVAAGLMMIHPGALTDVIGIAILIAILAYQVISEKRHAATA